MNEHNQNTLRNNDVDIRELLAAVWRGKWIVVIVTVVFAVISALYALSLPNIYKSDVLLAPTADSNGIKMPGQLGGLAALAGVNMGNGVSDKTMLALEILKSREFISRFIQKYDLFIPIMAAEGWSRRSNELKLDSDIYDSAAQQWIRKKKAPFQAKPSLLETYEKFMEIFSVNQDEETGMVTLSVLHYSPYLAEQWATALVREINDEMRQRELNEAQGSIAYLREQISQTSIADVRVMLFSLIEEQTKTVMLANVREEYLFQTVDPAVVAEEKAKPARALIVVLAVMLGVMLSVLTLLARHFNRR